jgi:hypothetical protein
MNTLAHKRGTNPKSKATRPFVTRAVHTTCMLCGATRENNEACTEATLLLKVTSHIQLLGCTLLRIRHPEHPAGAHYAARRLRMNACLPWCLAKRGPATESSIRSELCTNQGRCCVGHCQWMKAGTSHALHALHRLQALVDQKRTLEGNPGRHVRETCPSPLFLHGATAWALLLAALQYGSCTCIHAHSRGRSRSEEGQQQLRASGLDSIPQTASAVWIQRWLCTC